MYKNMLQIMLKVGSVGTVNDIVWWWYDDLRTPWDHRSSRQFGYDILIMSELLQLVIKKWNDGRTPEITRRRTMSQPRRRVLRTTIACDHRIDLTPAETVNLVSAGGLVELFGTTIEPKPAPQISCDKSSRQHTRTSTKIADNQLRHDCT